MSTQFQAVIVTNNVSFGEDLRQSILQETICGTANLIPHNDLHEAVKSNIIDVAIIELSSATPANMRYIREFKILAPYIPVLILTDSTSWNNDEILFLRSGADYITKKPIHLAQLLARISTVLRWKNIRNSGLNNTQNKIGALEFKPEIRRLVHPKNQEIQLTETETKMLSFLMRHRGQNVLREDLLKYVWGYNIESNTHTVETHIYRLRKKMGPHLRNKAFITTESRGYRLVAA